MVMPNPCGRFEQDRGARAVFPVEHCLPAKKIPLQWGGISFSLRRSALSRRLGLMMVPVAGRPQLGQIGSPAAGLVAKTRADDGSGSRSAAAWADWLSGGRSCFVRIVSAEVGRGLRRGGRRPARPPGHRPAPRRWAASRASAPAPAAWAGCARPGCRCTSGRCIRATRC